MSVVVSISGRGAGRIVATDGVRVVLEAESAAPPGASLSCNVEGAALPFKVKVSACKRAEPGAAETYRIEGRFVDLTRDQRAVLAGLTQGGSS